MNQAASDRVSDYFRAASLDLTPAAARRPVRVLYARASQDPDVSRSCASVLSSAERDRAARFAYEGDRCRFLQRRAFRRFCGAAALGLSTPLSRVQFTKTAKGRPYLAARPNVWFSFSAGGFGFLGAWSSTHGVGVDLEDQPRELEMTEIAGRFFSAAEAELVRVRKGQERSRTFYRLWSLKEAALKSIGEGLPFGLEAFEFELEPVTRVVRAPLAYAGHTLFDARFLSRTDGCAALITRSRP